MSIGSEVRLGPEGKKGAYTMTKPYAVKVARTVYEGGLLGD